jgi:hypothetical protein
MVSSLLCNAILYQALTPQTGAPECHAGGIDRIPVPRSIDIWSLGCVLSVAASWVVLGAKGVFVYMLMRQTATKKRLMAKAQSKAGETAGDSKPKEPGGDYFHDGKDVLQEVRDWHKHLRSVCRKTDTITPKLLDLIDTRMLLGKATERIGASDLCEALQSLLNLESQAREVFLTDSITEAMVETEKFVKVQQSRSKAVSTTASTFLGVQANQDRKSRKVKKIADLQLGETTHRSEALGLPTSPPTQRLRSAEGIATGLVEKTALPVESLPPLPAPVRTSTVAPSKSHLSRTNSHQRNLSSVREMPSPPRRETSMLSNLAQSSEETDGSAQNVWQARRDVERRNSLWKTTKKDKLLTQYLGDDRDIVSENLHPRKTLIC